MGKVTLTEYARLLKDEYCKQTGCKLPTKDYTAEEITEWHEEYAKWMNDAVVSAHINYRDMISKKYNNELDSLKKRLRDTQDDLKSSRKIIRAYNISPPDAKKKIDKLRELLDKAEADEYATRKRCDNLIASNRTIESKYNRLKNNPKYLAMVEANTILSKNCVSPIGPLKPFSSTHNEYDDDDDREAMINDMLSFEEKLNQEEDVYGEEPTNVR